MATFPLLFTVGHCSFVKGGGVDDFGNPLGDSWSAPVDKPVYGWGAPHSDEPVLRGHDREIVEVQLLVPPEFVCSARDRMILDGVEFEVIGNVETYNHSPFGFNPGGVVDLKAVNG